MDQWWAKEHKIVVVSPSANMWNWMRNEMQRQVFGAPSFPFSASFALKQLGIDIEEMYPIAAKAIQSNFYLNNLISQLQHLLSQLWFELKIWTPTQGSSVCGIQWIITDDRLHVYKGTNKKSWSYHTWEENSIVSVCSTQPNRIVCFIHFAHVTAFISDLDLKRSKSGQQTQARWGIRVPEWERTTSNCCGNTHR